MDYEKLHKDTIAKLQEMVNSGKITVKTACGICADFVPESEDERIRNFLIKQANSVLDSITDDDEEVTAWKSALAWLEKQGQVKESVISQHENKTCKENDDSLTSEDEKIRKEIRDFIIWSTDRGCITKEQVEKSNSWLAWLEKQGEQKLPDKIQIGQQYKCVASPIYTTFRIGEIYRPENEFLCSLMNLCSKCFKPVNLEKDFISKDDFPVLSNSLSIGKVEPKFKIGDTIVGSTGAIYHITEMYDDCYMTDTGCIIMFTAQDNFRIYKHQ